MTNIQLTQRGNPDGKFNSASISGSGSTVILDTVNDVTSVISAEGYKQHDYAYEAASVGTSVVVAIERQLSPSGSWVECATKTTSASGTDTVSFTGFAVNTRLKLKTITGGTPAIRNITGVASDPYRK